MSEPVRCPWPGSDPLYLEYHDREWQSLDACLWRFVGGQPIVNAWTTMADVPPRTPESEAMRQDLASRGFRFVGPTICYAFMQATGMVNDHLVSCFRCGAAPTSCSPVPATPRAR